MLYFRMNLFPFKQLRGFRSLFDSNYSSNDPGIVLLKDLRKT